MIRVKIKHITSAEPSNYIDFPTPEEAQAYVEEMKASEHWGKSEKDILVQDETKDEQGNILTPAVYYRQQAEVEFIMEDVAVEYTRNDILKQISELEEQITARRIREAVLSGDNSFIQQIDTLIAELRAQL